MPDDAALVRAINEIYAIAGNCSDGIVAIVRAYGDARERARAEEDATLVEDHGHSNGRIRASHKHLAAAIRARARNL